MVATPRDAVTLVLMREVPGVGTQPEVLMLQHHAKEAGAAGAYGFPGGMLQADDYIPAALALSRGVSLDAAAARCADATPAPQALGFWIAALRQTFEETGILLARYADGRFWELSPADRVQLAAQRRALQKGVTTFVNMMHDVERSLATDLLIYFAHWITPENRPLRFSRRVFLARVPSGVTALPDAVEVVEQLWITPEAALQRHAQGDLKMRPMTTDILRTLSRFRSAAQALEQLRDTPVTAVSPKATMQADGATRMVDSGDEDC
jgi:8-oxo-dGTP pyrophosphatase MutT (NUDIX family)